MQPVLVQTRAHSRGASLDSGQRWEERDGWGSEGYAGGCKFWKNTWALLSTTKSASHPRPFAVQFLFVILLFIV